MRVGEAHDSEDPKLVYAVYREKGSDELMIFGPGLVDERVVVYESERDKKWWVRSRENFTENLASGPRFTFLGSSRTDRG